MKFAALGLVVGIWVAYGAGGLPIEHRFAPVIVAVMVLFFVAIIFHAVVITKTGIYIRTGFPSIVVEKIAYGKIKSVSLKGQDNSRTKVVLWPARSGRGRDVGMIGDKVLSLEIELEGEKRKRRVPLQSFGPRDRAMIVQTLLERIEKTAESRVGKGKGDATLY